MELENLLLVNLNDIYDELDSENFGRTGAFLFNLGTEI